MDEKVLEEIQFHTETIESDTNSPLHLIREKEMEISGRVLAAKKKAEEIVAIARKEAVRAVQESQAEGERLAKERETEVLAELDQEVARIAEDTDSEIAQLETVIAERLDAGTEYVVGAILRKSR